MRGWLLVLLLVFGVGLRLGGMIEARVCRPPVAVGGR